MNILLTGSDGFIGSHLYTHLKKLNHKVTTIDIKSGNDLMDCPLDYHVDLVIHLAGLSGVRKSLDNPTEYWKQNVIAGQRLFENFPETKVVYASSSTAAEPWRNPYAMSKYSLEQIAEPYNALGLRFTTVYGQNAPDTMLIPKILRNEVEHINTNHSRDFIHVDDVLDAITTVMDTDLRGVIDVGTGQTNLLSKIVSNFHIEYTPVIGDEFEREDNLANINVLKDYGWSPKTDVFEYIKEHRNVN
jgi:nucleoside-diphosphate-sugar epimerase|tara:strand:+ start:1078 stop:1812 length:735 start_codon:yes stop_codon:yes gene_type:complete